MVQSPPEGPKVSRWANITLVIDVGDHPVNLPDDNDGLPPTLLSPTIINIKVSKMMYDTGSNINLLSLRAFKKIQIPRSHITKSASFHKVSGMEVQPLRKISLPVTLESPNNFWIKILDFHVTDLPLLY